MSIAFLFVFIIPVVAHAVQHANIVRSEGTSAAIRIDHSGGAMHLMNLTRSRPSVLPLHRSLSVQSDADERAVALQASVGSSWKHAGTPLSLFIAEGYEWPTFGSPAELSQHPNWKKYLTAVYGATVEDPKNYPIDLSTFWFLHQELLPEQIMGPLLSNLRNVDRLDCPLEAHDVYGNMSGYFGLNGHDPAGALWIYHPPHSNGYQDLAEGSWVEVTHCTYGVPGEDYERHGYWMYYAPGSGVFYNIGKTKVYGDHIEAVADLLGSTSGCGSTACPERYIDMVDAAANLGLTSLQFVAWHDMRCGPTAIEILDVHHAGDHACLPNLAGGLRASCACACNSDSLNGTDKACLSCSMNCSQRPTKAPQLSSLIFREPAERMDANAWRFGFVYWEPPFCQRDSVERQSGIFIVVALLTALSSFCFLQQCYQEQLRSSIILATLSAFFFGLDNFLIGYAGSYLCKPRAHMSMMFLLAGSMAFLLHVLLYALSDAYRIDCQATQKVSKLAKTCTALTAIFIGFAQLCSNIGFTLDPQQSGPHQALVCADVLIVAPFFYWYAGEVFTRHQLLGCLVIGIGALVMSEMSRWSDAHISLTGFLWVGLSMVLYGFSVITLRLTGTVPWRPRLILILVGMGFFGFLLFVRDLLAGGLREYYDSPRLLIWPLLNALTSNFGIWTVSFAYEVPGAIVGLLTAVVDSNSVVMMLMNRALLMYIPSMEKVAGMIIILSGCAFLAFPECGCLNKSREEC